MKKDIRNRWYRLNNLYKIINKEEQSVVFKINKAQELIYDLQKLYKRIMILKARQLGMTTYKMIDGLDKALFLENQTIVITAHKQEKQKELFQKVKYAFSMLPNSIDNGDGLIRHKPVPQYDSVNELYFPGNNSRIKVTLDSRSGTPTNLHITELSFRQDAEEMMTGTLPSVPKNTQITIETTANGIGNYSYNLRQKNYGTNGDNNGNGEFYCVFIPWYIDPDYRFPLDKGEIIVLPDIIKHIEKLPIDEEQKKWYLFKYNELSVVREDRVFQEFPSTSEEAFLGTGNPVFKTSIIKGLSKLIYQKDIVFQDLRIYRKAEEGEIYNYGVDTAEGGLDGDNSSISVRDKKGKLMAFYYGHIPADELCKVIDRLYELKYISQGKLGIERNNTGIATISKAKDYHRYYDLYAEKTVDKITNKKTKKYGRHTNMITRPLMISDYEQMIREGLIDEVDERLRSELYTFMYNEKNRPEAQQGCHDDAIISDCICIQMMKQQSIIQIS